MTDQARTVRDILEDRLAITQKLSAATAEHLRLNQSICGIEVLEMGKIEETEASLSQQRVALEKCEAVIGVLEKDMAALDMELESLTSGENT